MPITKTTFSPAEFETIAHLNKLLKQLEEKEAVQGTRAYPQMPPATLHNVCDACQRGLGFARCCNVVVDMHTSKLTMERALPDRMGAVVLRYHERCFPKNLLEDLNGRRRGASSEES